MSQRADQGESDDRELSIVDLSVAQADDALLDALSSSDPKIADELGEAELNALLLSWRREVDGEPMPELVDTDTAVTTIKHAALAHRHHGRGRKRKMLIPVAAAAAVLAITFSGTGVAARDAHPGDALWGLTKVLYADKARSVQAATDVRAEFEVARVAIARGQLEQAREALEEARVTLEAVDTEENREGLVAEHEELMTQIDEGEQPPPEPTTTAPPTESTTTSSEQPSETTLPSEPVEPAPQPITEPSNPPSSSTSEPEPSTTSSSTSSAEGQPSDSTTGMGTTSGTGGAGGTSSGGTADTGSVNTSG